MNAPSGELRAFCSHMTTDPIASFKTDQSNAILELIAAHEGGVAFAGDLNATPDEEAMQTFANAGLVDSWHVAHPDDDGPTHPSDNPDRRIDYVWMIDASRVVECHHVLDAPRDDVWASDHLGLICTLEL
jgi:endonuclease/exonuclease/phosphatase (EEP) superfamily protein YafD